jgi:hypothetical protein
MSFGTIILCNVQSLEAETALALKEFSENGGRLVLIDATPDRSLSMVNSAHQDSVVRSVFSGLHQNFKDNVIELAGPGSPQDLLDWTVSLLDDHNIPEDIEISKPDRNLYQIHNVFGDNDIWFFVNPNTSDPVHVTVRFPDKEREPWIWNPEDGSRHIFPYSDEMNSLKIDLMPLQSLLIVFDNKHVAEEFKTEEKPPKEEVANIIGPWQAEFIHVNGSRFSRNFNTLNDFGSTGDDELINFAGTVKYLTEFESDGRGKWLQLEEVNKGITEIYINGKKAGLNWYGLPLFRISDLLVKGRNKIEIIHTTLLSNYVMSLNQNPVAMRWTAGYEKLPAGIVGNVMILD